MPMPRANTHTRHLMTRPYPLLRSLLPVVAVLTFAAAMAFTLQYLGEPLIDHYNFRQTQTAISAYWMIRDGWHLAYETPVAGAPWSIPFEFPVYQTIVAAVSALLDTDLDRTGRFVSFVALTACTLPALQIRKRLSLSSEAFWIFCCLLFSAPIYLYWGRAFMMETTALFFTFAALPYFIDLLQRRNHVRGAILFALWTSLSLLQKVTTGLPVAAMLGAIWLFTLWRQEKRISGVLSARNIGLGALAFGVPLLLCIAWTEYSSHVRGQNTVGEYLTNASLSQWNWGTLKQRISKTLWVDVLWQRIFVRNLGGFLGVGVIVLGVLLPQRNVPRKLILLCLLFGLAPFFTFTNLYIVHDYYPTACVVYLIAAASLALGTWATRSATAQIAVLLVMAGVVANSVQRFSHFYLPAAQYDEQVVTNQELGLGQTLRRLTDPDDAILVYGYDWSSQIGYFAQRRSFTVPDWPGKLDEVWANPQAFLGGKQVGAIAVCNAAYKPTPHQITERILRQGKWDGARLGRCTVLARRAVSLPIKEGDAVPELQDCSARLNPVTSFPLDQPVKSAPVVVIDGLVGTATAAASDRGSVLFALTQHGKIVRAARGLETPTFTRELSPPRFSGMVDASGLDGQYGVAVIRSTAAGLAACKLDQQVQVWRSASPGG
jgi:hypothetical protein